MKVITMINLPEERKRNVLLFLKKNFGATQNKEKNF